MFSSNIVVEIASLSWISVESFFSLRPKTRAKSARAGAKTRIMNVNFQFMYMIIITPPSSRIDCWITVAGRSVTIFSIVVTSLVMRDMTSPVRRLTK